MRAFVILFFFFLLNIAAIAQKFEVGVETSIGSAHTSFKGDLSKMVGFSELEITTADVDTAFAQFDLSAPRWIKEVFPGLRIEVADEISKQLSRPIRAVRFFVRYEFIGGSLTISDPRLATQQESRKLKNQLKAIRLSLAGDAEGLASHLALMAIADETRVKPFFAKRYDLEIYAHLKRLFLGDYVIAEWGSRDKNNITFDVAAGIRFTADPSPILELGDILFVRDEIDDLLEGGILAPVESKTDKIAEAIQNVTFGKFRDPRVVPSFGWFLRGELPVNFGGRFSLVAGGELSMQQHTAIKGTKPMYSIYGFAGIRWLVLGNDKK